MIAKRLPPCLPLAVAVFLAACAAATVSATAPSRRMTSIGPVLADSGGMTLYTYDDDPPGVSACYRVCAIAWPPAEAAADAMPAGRFSVITRSNGTKQWAIKGAPLYGYFRDAKPGDTRGDGDEGVWHVARP